MQVADAGTVTDLFALLKSGEGGAGKPRSPPSVSSLQDVLLGLGVGTIAPTDSIPIRVQDMCAGPGLDFNGRGLSMENRIRLEAMQALAAQGFHRTRTPVERGSALATALKARLLEGKPGTPEVDRVCRALADMGLQAVGCEVPVASFSFRFATMMDVLAVHPASGKLVVVEVKLDASTRDAVLGEGGLPRLRPVVLDAIDVPMYGPPLEHLPQNPEWRACIQAWLAACAIHLDYGVAEEYVSWAVVFIRPTHTQIITQTMAPCLGFVEDLLRLTKLALVP